MKKLHAYLLVVTLLSFWGYTANAQNPRETLNPLINSGEVLKKAYELHGKGQYKDAISEYAKIPVSDTNYSEALYQLIDCYYSDSNYVVAEKYLATAFDLFPDQTNKWFTYAGNIYSDSKKYDQALSAYDSLIAHNPYDHLAYFNKGICYFRQTKYDEAEANFRKCIMLNPYYSSAHHFLGRIAYFKGNLVQAMLGFATNLIVAPGNKYQIASIQYLTAIAEMNDEANDFLKKYKRSSQDNFEEVQDIIVSKIALDKKYKLKTELEDPIVRQLQVMLEKMEYNESDKGFWMQYYVPCFKMLWDKKLFEPMVFYMFSEINSKKINDYNKKEKKKIEGFSTEFVNYMNEIRETQELMVNKRKDAQIRYYVKGGRIQGVGKYGLSSKNEYILIDKWKFFHENGHVRSTGAFDENGNKKGEWSYYFENGLLKEKTVFVDDKSQGKSEVWNDNGLLYQSATYSNDKLTGEEKTYFYSGLPRSVMFYKEGKRDGKAKYFDKNGVLASEYVYVDDQADGVATAYHPNGKVEWKLSYEKDLPVGVYKEFHPNGQLKATGEYDEKGNKTGEWKYFYDNGVQEYLEHYANGKLDGEYFSYYRNGKIETKSFYKKGEIDDKKTDYDDDGIIYSEATFERGRLRDIKFFNKKGEVISNTTSRKGNATIVFYNPDGTKSNDGYYTKDGVLEGKGTYYYKNGSKSREADYKNGYLEGHSVYYHENGKMSQDGYYKNNEPDGYFINYYTNGQINDEGWFRAGDRQGTFLAYDLLANKTAKTYYLDGNKNGVQEYYFPTGKLDYKEYFDHGWFYRLDQFDTTTGKLISKSVLDKGTGKILLKHYNGTPFVENNYKYYKLNGQRTVWNADGNKRLVCFYKNGELDSTYIACYPNGKIESEGSYSEGDKVGKWKYYYQSGQLSEVETYINGKLEGLDVQYNEDNTIDKEMYFKNGKLDSAYRIYGDNKQLIVQYNYDNDVLVSYTYEDAQGKLIAPIDLNRGTGKVVAYYRNGKKSAEVEFTESLVHGVRNFYFSNGNPYVAQTRDNGYDNGVKKVYYLSGKIKKEENFYYGERHGVQKYFTETGLPIYEINYYLGDLHGESKYFTAGKATSTFVYYFGQMEQKK